MKKFIAFLILLMLAVGAMAQDSKDVQLMGQTFAFRPVKGRDYYMGVTEVTQAQYTAVMGENPSHFNGKDLPVERVSWYDAICFCNRLSMLAACKPVYAVDGETDVGKWGYEAHKGKRITGKITMNLEADGFRLPTDEEWEYAARGGENFMFAGSDRLDDVGWYAANCHSHTHPVAGKKPNAYGLYDMSGNVWEWVWDYYGNDVFTRHYRGGSWYYISSYSRVSFQSYYFAHYQGDFVGFRICRAAGAFL